MQDIHGIRPPVMAGLDPALVDLLLIAAAVLLGVGILVLLIRYFRKGRKARSIPEIIPSIAPLDRAMADLDRLAGGTTVDPRAFYFELSRIVKAYMGEVFGVNCPEMTTPELIRTVKGLNLSRGLKQEIILFQEVSDPFRYAPKAPSAEQLQDDLARVRSLVTQTDRETAPRPDPAADPADKGGGAS